MRIAHAASGATSHIVRFDCYEADLDSGQLRKRGIRIKLREQSFQVLAVLLARPGQVITREDLRRQLWPDDVFVDFENNLNAVVARLREALSDSAEHPRFVETLPKRGYRFIGEVSLPPSATAEEPARRPRLIVLPFVNLSGDTAEEYLSDAMTDEIITELASAAPEHLAVIARTTTMHYKGSCKDIPHIGRELSIDYVVEGAVHRACNRVAINVQLVRVSDQAHVFAKKYAVDLRDLFSIQGSAARDIASSLGITPRGLSTTGGARHKPTSDHLAYSEYTKARHHMGKGFGGSFTDAKERLEKAIERDPEFALAYDALAEIYWYLGYFGFMSPRQAFSRGIVYAVRALEIDNTRAETHALLGQFHKTVEYNWAEVQREMSLALQLDPNSPLVRMRYAVSGLMPHGRLQEATAELERALELDPLSFFGRFWLGIMLLLSRDYERGIEEGRRLLELDPASYLAHFVVAVCYRYQKRFGEAIIAQQKAVELSGGSAIMYGVLGTAYAESGDTAAARGVLQHLQKMAAQSYVAPMSFAGLYLGLGEIDAAFEWLDRAVEECDQFIMPIKTYGLFGPIRSDPRFHVLLRKMNLES